MLKDEIYVPNNKPIYAFYLSEERFRDKDFPAWFCNAIIKRDIVQYATIGHDQVIYWISSATNLHHNESIKLGNYVYIDVLGNYRTMGKKEFELLYRLKEWDD